MQHWILTSAQDFYANAKDILNKCRASFYIEVGDGKGGYRQILITRENESAIPSIMLEGIEGFTYRQFIIVSSPDVTIDTEKCIYDQDILPYVIEGTGGRETEDIIECIYLRMILITKLMDASAKSLYKKLYKNLEANPNFRKGFHQGSSMHKNALYDLRIIHKTKRFGLNNPLSILTIEEKEE